jgi:hypothetical protein
VYGYSDGEVVIPCEATHVIVIVDFVLIAFSHHFENIVEANCHEYVERIEEWAVRWLPLPI